MESSAIEGMIKDHTEAVEKGKFSMPTCCCHQCHKKVDDYRLHECRKRQLRVVNKDIVKVFITFLLRWRCPLCQCTFTDYPPFIIPHKRFVLFDMCRFSQKYLESERATYRSTVKKDASDIGYIDPATGLCEQFLSHSTLYRFIEYLTDMYPYPLINSFLISSGKYRTETRKSILMRALCAVKNIAKKSIFPDFKTITV